MSAPTFSPGVVSVTFRSLDPELIIAECVRAGLTGIEWGGDVHVPHGDVDTAERVGALTRAAGLTVAAYGSYYRFDDVLGGPDATLRFETVLETAVALGAPVIRVWAGRKASGDATETERETIVEKAREIGEAARGHGIEVAFEYHRGTLTDTNDSALDLLTRVDHPAIKSLWQPAHDEDIPTRIAGLNRILPYLAHIHCFYWTVKPGEDRPERLPLRDGEDAWRAYLSAVRDSGRAELDRIWVLMEFVRDDSVAQFHEDAESIKRWLNEINRAR